MELRENFWVARKKNVRAAEIESVAAFNEAAAMAADRAVGLQHLAFVPAAGRCHRETGESAAENPDFHWFVSGRAGTAPVESTGAPELPKLPRRIPVAEVIDELLHGLGGLRMADHLREKFRRHRDDVRA